MQTPTRLFPVLRIGLGLVLALLLVGLALFVTRIRDSRAESLPVYGQVGDFTLTNQMGAAVSVADLRGRVWVADIIFTRCAGPCLVMSGQMKQLQRDLPADSEALLVSLTTDPDFDTPAVLRTYASRFEADSARWLFLTGEKPQIAKLAIDFLKLTSVEKKAEERESPQDLFIHSTVFVIVDPQARLRGMFEMVGEGVNPAKVREEILSAIERLERER